MLIYEAYNKENGKVYIGLTTSSLNKRKSSHLRSAKSGSSSHFHKAIRKYGEDAFEWCVLSWTESLDDLHATEQLIISLYPFNRTYNLSKGGEHPAYGMKHTDKTKRICGEYAKQRWDGKRAIDKYPEWVFKLGSYKEAKKHGVPKTTWYRTRREMGINK